jgi:hypothetical protein
MRDSESRTYSAWYDKTRLDDSDTGANQGNLNQKLDYSHGSFSSLQIPCDIFCKTVF